MKDLLTAEEGRVEEGTGRCHWTGGSSHVTPPRTRLRAAGRVERHRESPKGKSSGAGAERWCTLSKTLPCIKKNTLLKRSDFRLMNEHTNPSNRLEVAGFQLYADTPEALTSR